MRWALLAGVVCIAWMLLCRCDVIWQRARSSTRSYQVRNVKDAESAADQLERLTQRVEKILGSGGHPHSDPRITRIRTRWNGTLAELDGQRAGNIAHSVGKRAISICIRDPNGALADDNACMFVIIHELAHIATHSIGHTPEFWLNMKYLLEVAEHARAYTYTDHDRDHVMLCGRVLGTSPLTCVKEGSCKSAM